MVSSFTKIEMKVTMNKVLAMLISLAIPLLCLACGDDEPAGAPTSTRALEFFAARVAAAEAKALVDSGQGVLVDTRSSEQFANRRAAGAILAPLEAIRANPDIPAIAAIPEDQQMILYCT